MEGLTIALTLLVVAAVPLGIRTAKAARGSTLVGAARWESLAIVSVGLTELFIAAAGKSVDDSWAAPLRWAAACATFCGPMARLGARRPHQVEWQGVVVALWGILVLPALEVFVLRRGQLIEIHAARSGFIWLLVLGGVADSLPTRRWLAGLSLACAQLVLMGQYLPGTRQWFTPDTSDAPLGALGLAFLVVAQACQALPRPTPQTRPGLTGIWLDFRDQFGAWWAVRVLVRINAVAESSDWPIRLTWSGFTTVAPPNHDRGDPSTQLRRDERSNWRCQCVDNDLHDEQRQALRQLVANLLRRFVDERWIAGRLGDVRLEA